MYNTLLLLFFLVMTTLASINTQGLRTPDRWRTAFSFFQRNRCDIVLLQETHWTVELEMQIKRDWDGVIIFNHGTNLARGVAILIHPHLEHNIRHTRRDDSGRILNILLDFEDHTLNIINTYAPSTDIERRHFFSTLEQFISRDHENVIGGDFNCISDPRLDKLGGNPNIRQPASLLLNTISLQHGLTDIWRDRHKDERNFTWTGRHPTDTSFIRTRIDKFLISRSITHFVIQAAISPFAHSDHDYISLSIDFDCIPRGPGYWHFNNDLLSDVIFQSEIERFWDDWQTKFDLFSNPFVWWEKAKHNFKCIAIRRAKIKGKLQRHERSQLERKLKKLQGKAINGNNSDIEKYLLAKEQLKQWDMKDLESTKIRAKARFLEEGEKSTRYFFSLEKHRKAEHTMRMLKRDNLDIVTEPGDLISETRNFYKTLYSAQPCDKTARDQFLSVDTPKLPVNARESCEGPITVEELKKALTSMENNKSPGIDGLSTNFYKHFWPLLCEKLALVYNYAFETGCLTVSQRRGVISLIFKKGNRTLLKNWRPITLLTTDYKILTKALANRLQRVLSFVIHPDQTASVKGRTINDNVRLLHDAVSYANESNIPLAIVSVDQLKAFDRVSHEFLLKCLENFGFGPNFINWIRIIYNSVSSSVKVNGWLTAFIHLERGLRQGCALSMPLYVLTAETMAINIRANPRIRGLRPPGSMVDTEVKLSQFADDTTLLLTDDQSIAETFRTFELYERASGAKINQGKCKGLWCGAFAWRTDQIYGFDWFNDFIPEKILGQYLGNVDCTRVNWEAKAKKINNTMNIWRHRELSYKGRALVINGLLTSTLWYNATSLSMPIWVIKQMEQTIYRFFWSDKHPLVNRDILALPLRRGGFNIARLESKMYALRLNTLRRLLTGEDANWKYFTAHFLRVSSMRLGKLTLALEYRLQDIDRDIPAFHKELLIAWSKNRPHHTRTNIPESRADTLNEPLFRNNLIAIDNKPLFYKDWVASGLVQLKDICYEVIPGFLPVRAIHEILTEHEENRDRTLERTMREFAEVLRAIPDEWKLRVTQLVESQQSSAQPCFSIPACIPGNPPVDITNGSTRVFYWHLRENEQGSIPALEHWQQTLQPQPVFDSSFWKNLYSSRVTNVLGDLNWKVVHRVLPTALSLNRMEVYDTPNCHKCGRIETVEHLLVSCPTTDTFWSQVNIYVNKITDNSLNLTDYIKLLGWIPGKQLGVYTKVVDLVNWTLTIARYAIHKSAVNYRVRSEVTPIDAIFRAVIKGHLRFQFKLYHTRGTQYLFPYDWCIGEAFAKVVNDTLVFTM